MKAILVTLMHLFPHEIYVYLYIMMRALILCACLVISSPLLAQKHKKVKAKPMKVSTGLSIDSLKKHYEAYRLEDVKRDLSLYERGSEADRTVLEQYTARLERMERMLPHTEVLPLVGRYDTSWSDLPALLEKLSPQLARSIQIASKGDDQHEYRFEVKLGQLHFALHRDAEKQALVRTDYPVGESAYSESLGANISTKEGKENYPVLLSDGIRLLFAREVVEGLGGYDLYLTRYNIDRGEFLEPSLLGLPFNSPANDYLLAYDEEQDRTFLLSDRDSAVGALKLYVFRGLPQALKEKSDATEEETRSLEEQIRDARLMVPLIADNNKSK